MAKKQKRKKLTKLVVKFEPSSNHKEEFAQFVNDVLSNKNNKKEL
ncbi:MAG: hypothetical protein ACKKMW_02140 [Candidatus Nealsonbacteria bacterium]